MTEITRVPLQPIAKGSLTKLWLGIAIIVLLAAGIAWASMPKGLDIDTLTEGQGDSPTGEDVAFIHYTGSLPDGTVFDQSQPIPLPVEGFLPAGTPMPLGEGETIPGFRDAVLQMQRGGKYDVHIPADQAYGAEPPQGSPIPPNSDLNFEIELVDFMPRAEFEQKVQQLQQVMMQQQMQQMQQDGGAPGAPGAPPPDAMPIPNAE